MNYLTAINNYIFRLTGYRDFIVSTQHSNDYYIACVKNNYLQIKDADKWDYRAFHEFAHFLESDDENILLPDYGLVLRTKESWMREEKASLIEESLKRNKLFMAYINDSHMPRRKKKWRLFSNEELENRIVHNITLVKRFSHFI